MKNRIVYLGIGNRLRGDDAAGSILAEKLKNLGFTAYDGGVMPETFTGTIKKTSPAELILIDACSMGLSPGEFAFIPLTKISADDAFHAHSMSVTKLIEYLKKSIPFIKFIGIEPANTEFSEELSPAVSKSIERLVDILTAGNLFLIREL